MCLIMIEIAAIVLPARPQDQDVLNGLADAIVAARPPLVMVWAVYGGAVQTGRTGVMSRGMRQAMYQVGWGCELGAEAR